MVKDEGLVNEKAQFARALLGELPEIVKGAEATLFRAAEMLCGFLGIDFAGPDISLAELKTTASAGAAATIK